MLLFGDLLFNDCMIAKFSFSISKQKVKFAITAEQENIVGVAWRLRAPIKLFLISVILNENKKALPGICS